jgi:hypothetical protein
MGIVTHRVYKTVRGRQGQRGCGPAVVRLQQADGSERTDPAARQQKGREMCLPPLQTDGSV